MPSCPDGGGAGGVAPGVTLSVISHGQGADVLRLLGELAGLSAPALRRVVVTLNLPEPAVHAELRARAWPFTCTCRENPEPIGFAANHNRAFAAVRERSGVPEFFAVSNPDIHLGADPFDALLAALRADARAGAAYPVQRDRDGALQDFERRVPTPRRLLRRHVLRRRAEIAADAAPEWVNAAFLLLRGSAWAQLGGFDAGYRMYCEDVDLCLRLQLAGWRLVRADATVVHDAQRASGHSLRYLRWHVVSLLRLWRSPVLRDWRARAGAVPG